MKVHELQKMVARLKLPEDAVEFMGAFSHLKNYELADLNPAIRRLRAPAFSRADALNRLQESLEDQEAFRRVTRSLTDNRSCTKAMLTELYRELFGRKLIVRSGETKSAIAEHFVKERRRLANLRTA